jgi:hypothetical protein
MRELLRRASDCGFVGGGGGGGPHGATPWPNSQRGRWNCAPSGEWRIPRSVCQHWLQSGPGVFTLETGICVSPNPDKTRGSVRVLHKGLKNLVATEATCRMLFGTGTWEVLNVPPNSRAQWNPGFGEEASG